MTYQRDCAKRLNLGVIGVGSHCYRNILPCLHHLPVRLVAMCDVNADLLARTAPEYGVTQTFTSTAAMYAAGLGLDAVLICVSPQLHPRLAAEAFAAGLHVWMEKPVARRAAEVRDLLAQRGDRVCVVGYKKAFMPGIAKARELLAGGQPGDLFTVLGEYAMDLPADGPAALAAGNTGNWLSNGCHPVSAMLALGGEVTAVTAQRGGNGGGVCILEYANGALGNLHLAAGMRGPTERYSVFARQGHLVIENCRRVTLHRGIPFQYGVTTDYVPPGADHGSVVWESQNTLATLENQSLFTQGMYGELMHFCTCVLEGRQPSDGSLEFALQEKLVFEAALLSQGRRVELAGLLGG